MRKSYDSGGMNLTIGVCEDDGNYTSVLKDYLQRYQNEKGIRFDVHYYSNGQEICTADTRFHIVFMDIEMPKMDGITASKILRKNDQYFVLIFITNLAELAIKGYEVNAMDFVVKPIAYEEFAFKLDKAVRMVRLSLRESVVMRTKDNSLVKVNLSDIVYIEVVLHDVIVHLLKSQFEVHKPLRKVMAQIGSSDFIRINKCYFINLRYLKKIDRMDAVMPNGRLQISRSEKKNVSEAFIRYVAEREL